MKSLLLYGQNQAAATGVAYLDASTYYQYPLGRVERTATTESIAQFKFTAAGTVRNWRLYAPSNSVTNTTPCYVRVNGSNTSITISFTSDQTGEKEDTTNSASISANDLLCYSFAPPTEGGSNYLQISVGSLEFEPTTSGNTYTFLGQSTGTSSYTTASATRYMPWHDNSNTTNSSDLLSVPVYGGGTIEHWASYAASVRATATTRQLVINGTNSTTHQNSHTAANTWVYDTSTSTLSDGDLIGQSITSGTGTDTFQPGASAVTIYNTSGKWSSSLCDQTAIAFAAATTYYLPIGGDLAGVADTTEANVEQRFRFQVAAEYIWTNVSANAITGGTTTFTLRKNTADETGIQTSYTSGQTGAKTDTGSVSYASGDLASIKVSVGTGGTTTLRSAALGWNSSSSGVSGTLAATEAQDTSSISGTVTFRVSGTLAATEAQDTATFSGNVKGNITGTLAATEAQDTATGTGRVYKVITGTFAATEAQDTFSASGSATTGGATITGTLAATEAQDTASFTGSVVASITGTLAATEAQDTASFTGNVVANVTGTLVVTEAQDTASLTGTVQQNITGTLSATEAQDIAYFVGLNGSVSVIFGSGVGFRGVSSSGVSGKSYTDTGSVFVGVSGSNPDSVSHREPI